MRIEQSHVGKEAIIRGDGMSPAYIEIVEPNKLPSERLKELADEITRQEEGLLKAGHGMFNQTTDVILRKALCVLLDERLGRG